MTKIINLNIKNYKAVEAFEASPEGNIITINGPNGAGKTSVLDAIAAALGGVNKRDTPKPIRDGEDSAEIVLETDELVVTRRFTKSGSTLTVSSQDGAKFPKGQAKLDDLLGKLSLDPFAFTQLSEKDQLEQLLDLVDLPFDPERLAMQREGIFNRRTEVGRQAKAIGEVTVNESLPTEEHSASSLIASINEAHDQNRRIGQARQASIDLQDKIECLERELKEAQQHLTQALKVAHQDEVDVTELENKLSTIEETNAKIRANNQARDLKLQKDGMDSEYAQLTEDIKTLDKTKARGLAAAKMPVPGLGFDKHGVTYEGIPFKQVNTASQIRVSFAMAMALNPKLRVVRIAEGSLLDDDNMALIADMANEHDYQVWIERVGEGDGTGIVIEEGKVKA